MGDETGSANRVVTRRGSIDEMVIQGGVRASLAIASREPAMDGLASLPRADLDHDVSILMTAGAGAGR
jgi:hypothetical protein